MAHPVGSTAALGASQLAGWSVDPWVAAPLALATAIYVRGWWRLRRRAPHHLGGERLAAFLAGVGAIAVALESPLHLLASVSLRAHMAQHLLLMVVGPALIWLGAPLVPLLHGSPRRLVRGSIGRGLAGAPVRALGRALARPAVAWVAFAASTVAWHTPAMYERALGSEGWHQVQHACFLGTGLLFWWPVIAPWPARPVASPWVMVIYLLLADLQNTVLSAWLAFTGRVVYPSYEAAARLSDGGALADQTGAAAIMWVPGSLAFLVPAVWLVGRALSPPTSAEPASSSWPGGAFAPPNPTAASRRLPGAARWASRIGGPR